VDQGGKPKISQSGGGGGGYNPPRQGGGPVKVDSTSILAKGVTPSAVFKGVSSGEDEALSKYRITGKDEEAQDIDWMRTLRAASRAAVEEPAEVVAMRTPEPTATTSVASGYAYSRPPQHTGPTPSQQMRREDNVFSNRNNPHNNPPPPGYVANKPQNQPISGIRDTSQQVNPANSKLYNPPEQQQQSKYRSTGITVSESTIKPSSLRDTSDALEKYRIKESDLNNDAQQQSAASQPKPMFKDNSDPLEKFRVKPPEEEEKTWVIYLFGLGTDPGKPVELRCDGNPVFMGEGMNGVVNTRVSYASQGEVTQMNLSIKSMNFTLPKNLEIGKGRFIKFSIEQGQLKFRQQRTEIDN
jgi:hypothetical protein